MNKSKLPLVLLLVFLVNLIALQIPTVTYNGEDVPLLIILWFVNTILVAVVLTVSMAHASYTSKRSFGGRTDTEL